MRKGISRYLLGAGVLAVLGAACLTAGLFDRQVARTQRNLAALTFDDPDEAFESVERYMEYGSRLPWFGSGPLNDLRARKAALQYWTRDYDRLIPSQPDAIGALPPDNVQLQLIVANAVYRTGQARAKDRATTREALDTALGAYLAVLKNSERNVTAAYNYEYLVRVRDDIDKGRRDPELTDTAEDGPAGRKGGPPPQDLNKSDFKILIPLESDEMDKGAAPGKGGPIERKG